METARQPHSMMPTAPRRSGWLWFVAVGAILVVGAVVYAMTRNQANTAASAQPPAVLATPAALPQTPPPTPQTTHRQQRSYFAHHGPNPGKHSGTVI